jgi:hypothetical protein
MVNFTRNGESLIRACCLLLINPLVTNIIKKKSKELKFTELIPRVVSPHAPNVKAEAPGSPPYGQN